MLLLVAALGLVTAGSASALGSRLRSPSAHAVATLEHYPGTANCTEMWFTQTLDHFGFATPPGGKSTFQQRYYYCDQHWKRPQGKDSEPGPIFFYSGNEADVGLYVNHTGLMWENAEDFRALLLFVEHRFFGKSLPFADDPYSSAHLNYLSPEQALADYATFLKNFTDSLGVAHIPTITFGGSYGGMLSAWFRMKYPNVVDGAIAGSAPVLGFLGQHPPVDEEAFNRIVTEDASSKGGAKDSCANNIRKTWPEVFSLGKTAQGRNELAGLLRLCSIPKSSDEVVSMANWATQAYVYTAMGSYPYPSNYMLMGGEGMLPAYPLRKSCEPMENLPASPTQSQLLRAMADSLELFFNATQDKSCYNWTAAPNEASQIIDWLWGYLACTELLLPSGQDGKTDMFWNAPFDLKSYIAQCEQEYGVATRPLWANTQFWGRSLEQASNIIFSNGELDPWRGGGVLQNVSDTVVSYVVADAGHHMDLMFSNSNDNPSVKFVRSKEVEFMHKWITEATIRARNH